jgi:hypothetical protein
MQQHKTLFMSKKQKAEPVERLVKDGLIAQWLEHLTFNQRVLGSSPSESSIPICRGSLEFERLK